ncbi:uncharacterized protein BKA55DRAFT_698165 [Fusarium redolens]|uniref:Uncharacterized protein n=1 Tax=Fusarium redolens TaxID=48865 RepID=A0A9P9JPE4_FUSRE|nr:uncharacterized protein BKA55DRAFT_698165 [Fusarium redolens]KAH7208447.1 hypothetical protein BKA55DRAFT_698165 [Fusarium redolens]
MTVLFAGQDPYVTIEFRTSNWLAEQLEGNRLTDYICNLHDKRLVVYVSCTVSSWSPVSMDEFYYQMRVMKAIHGNMRVYPRESEALWDELKIGDVRAFDEIAASGINFIYRPKTCFGVGKCSLPLPEGEHVVKKSYSCSGNDVKVLHAPARHKLSCHIPRSEEIPNTDKLKSRHRRPAKKKHEKPDSHKNLWFHQEYLSSFGVLGEFRVFLCQGKVINSAITKFSAGFRAEDELSGRVFAAKAVDENAFWWYSDVREQQRKKWEELYTFAEFVCDALSRRHDAQEHYESLEIGLRLDIGVSELTSNGVFFVNEATRFHCADYMSDIISMPSYRTSEVLGKAIAEVYKSGRW